MKKETKEIMMFVFILIMFITGMISLYDYAYNNGQKYVHENLCKSVGLHYQSILPHISAGELYCFNEEGEWIKIRGYIK